MSRNKQLKQKCWIQELLRKKYSYYSFIEKMLLDGGWFFQHFTRMSSTDFEELFSMDGPNIRKTNTNMKEAIPEKVRLAVCLRYVASGDLYRSLMYTFKISDSTISIIIPEVCKALNKVLKGHVKISNAKETDLEELLNILDCFFDPEKKAIQPKKYFPNNFNRRRAKSFNRKKKSSSSDRQSPNASTDNQTDPVSDTTTPRSDEQEKVAATQEPVASQ